jgi:hypothetical protein
MINMTIKQKKSIFLHHPHDSKDDPSCLPLVLRDEVRYISLQYFVQFKGFLIDKQGHFPLGQLILEKQPYINDNTE